MQRAKPEAVTRLGLLGSEDAAQALCLLTPGAGMTGDLDQHIGLWDVNGVVTYLGQEHSVHLHHSIMIMIMHASTCLLCTDQMFTDLYSLRRAMQDVSTESQLQPITACIGSNAQKAQSRHVVTMFSNVERRYTSCPAEPS